MKNLIFTLLILIYTPTLAQTDLRNTLEEYLKLVETKNSEKVMDYMYPKFFELYPRDLMVKTLDESMNESTLEIELMDSKILNISMRYEHMEEPMNIEQGNADDLSFIARWLKAECEQEGWGLWNNWEGMGAGDMVPWRWFCTLRIAKA